MADDTTGDAQWRSVCRHCEAARAEIHADLAETAHEAFYKASIEQAVEAAVGVGMAAIIEAGALIHAIAPSIAGTAWEVYLLDTLRGAIRGAGHAVDEHGVNQSYLNG